MVADESNDDRTQSFVALTMGTTVSHYKVIEKIGAGGMGEVYLAEDTKLKRKVALKFLPPHLCQDEECHERFKREAQAAAKLDHPNIIHVYEVSEFNGRPFFAMQHVEGLSLKEFSADKDLPVEKILELGIQICEGLNDAHEKGVTHRDIKPSNILVDSHGRAKIVDFGLASVAGTDQLTKTGSTLGTIGYMSPEQVLGKEIDRRSDLFSLGVVLYELIAKQNPFKRDSEAATLRAVSDDTPHPVARYRADVPDGLQSIIDKALEKDVRTRYQHADGMLSDLIRLKRSLESGQATVSGQVVSRHASRKWWPAALIVVVAASVLIVTKPWRDDSTADKPDRIMLAVLPFKNLGTPDDEYFTDGVTEEILSRLSAISGLGVISSTSSFSYKKSDKTLPEIARELNVEYVLEGNIRWDRRDGTDWIRITPQLIQVDGDIHLWSQSYDQELTSVFAIQSQIAEQVASALDIQLLESAKNAINNIPTQNIQAYAYYLRALDLPYVVPQSCQQSIEYLRTATSLDSLFGLAWAELSFRMSAYHVYSSFAAYTPGIKEAELIARKAIELNPELPDVYRALGQYYYWVEWDFERAFENFEKALSINANSVPLLRSLGMISARVGDRKASREYFRRANELDPTAFDLIYVHHALKEKQYSEALDHLERGLAFEPDNIDLTALHYIVIGFKMADLEKLRQVIPDSLREYTDNPNAYELFSFLAEFEGDYDECFRLISEHLVDAINPYDSAQSYLRLAYVQLWSGRDDFVIYADSGASVVENMLNQEMVTSLQAISSSILSILNALRGNDERARQTADSVLSIDLSEKDASNAWIPKYYCTLTLIETGERDRVFNLLDTLLAGPSLVTLVEIKYSPRFDALRDDPRFRALLEKYEKEHGI